MQVHTKRFGGRFLAGYLKNLGVNGIGSPKPMGNSQGKNARKLGGENTGVLDVQKSSSILLYEKKLRYGDLKKREKETKGESKKIPMPDGGCAIQRGGRTPNVGSPLKRENLKKWEIPGKA